MLDAAALVLRSLALGAHVMVPAALAVALRRSGAPVWSRATGGPASPEPASSAPRSVAATLERWPPVAPVLLAAALTATLVAVSRHPDPWIGAGLWNAGPGRLPLVALVLALTLLGLDLVLAWTVPRRSPGWLDWSLAATVALLVLVPTVLVDELARIGAGPASSLGAFAGACLARLLLVLAAGEVLAPGRPWIAPLAGVACGASWFALPDPLAASLAASGLGWTLAVGAGILIACRFLPRRLVRPALAVAVLLVLLFLDRSGDLSQALAMAPERLQPPPL